MTLTRYILTEQRKHPHASGDLSIILSAVATACKALSSAVRRAGMLSLYGLHGSTNSTGDDQKKLDVIANGALRDGDGWGGVGGHGRLQCGGVCAGPPPSSPRVSVGPGAHLVDAALLLRAAPPPSPSRPPTLSAAPPPTRLPPPPSQRSGSTR